jgi:hypothetical protein
LKSLSLGWHSMRKWASPAAPSMMLSTQRFHSSGEAFCRSGRWTPAGQSPCGRPRGGGCQGRGGPRFI